MMTIEDELQELVNRRKELIVRMSSVVDITTPELHIDYVAGDHYDEMIPGLHVRDALRESTDITFWICDAVKNVYIHEMKHSLMKVITILTGRAFVEVKGTEPVEMKEHDSMRLEPEAVHSMFFPEHCKFTCLFRPKIIVEKTG